MQNEKVKWWCSDPELRQMYKKYHSDAGFDLVAAVDCALWPNDEVPKAVPTSLHVAIPFGYVGLINSRSGLTLRTNTGVDAGVIDAGYRGEVMVMMRTYGNKIMINRGDRIAQLVVVPCVLDDERVDSLEELDTNTERGHNGFGSTGVQ